MKTITMTLNEDDYAYLVSCVEAAGDFCLPFREVTYKDQELKTIKQLQGRTIKGIKGLGSKSGTVYIETEDGGRLALESMKIKETLGADDYIAMGLFSKEDMAAIKRAKALGVFL